MASGLLPRRSENVNIRELSPKLPLCPLPTPACPNQIVFERGWLRVMQLTDASEIMIVVVHVNDVVRSNNKDRTVGKKYKYTRDRVFRP